MKKAGASELGSDIQLNVCDGEGEKSSNTMMRTVTYRKACFMINIYICL